MMQLLRAGGIDLMHDGQREADEDNPEGYWEWEEIKSLQKHPRIIEKAEGKAIKVVSALIPALPPRHRYKIIFMRRPVEEVVASQWKMLERRGQNPKSEREHLIATQETHLAQTLSASRSRPSVELLEVDFHEMVSHPASEIRKLADFLGASFHGEPEALAKVVKPELHRNRISTADR